MMKQLQQIQTPILLSGILLVVAIYATLAGQVIERVIIELFINLLLVISLQTFMGNSGVASFAHVGFMGIGAFTAALLTMPLEMKNRALRELYPVLQNIQADFLLAILLAGIVTAMIAAILSYPLMRLSGSASVIATFALLVIIHVVLKNWTQVTNGPRSVFGVEKLTTLPLVFVVSVISVFFAVMFKESNLGLMLRSSREDEKAACSIGINVVRIRWIAFTVSAFFCGIAGALYAHFLGQFSADQFYLETTFVVLSMLIIGGSLTVSGATLGVLGVTLFTELLRQAEVSINLADVLPIQITGAAPILVSLVMIVMLILRPAGLWVRDEIQIWRDQSEQSA